MVGFNYVIELVPDKKYGALDPDTGEWNGIVRQILEKVYTIPYISADIIISIILTLPFYFLFFLPTSFIFFQI